MLKQRGLFPILTLLAFLLAMPCRSWAQVYSYVDEHGVRNFTNIPPKGPVRDLKISAFSATAGAPAPNVAQIRSADLESIIQKYADAYQVDPSLIRSMISAESNFNVRAVSPKGAQGLMQLMPETATRVGVRDPFDPEENIQGGAKHLRSLLDMFDNNLPLTLAAYNAGENRVQRIGKIPNIRETRDYVRNVTQRYGKTQLSTTEASNQKLFIFKYIDRNGILHLTNIPPVSTIDPAVAMRAGNQSSK